jgi:hypothetical protein
MVEEICAQQAEFFLVMVREYSYNTNSVIDKPAVAAVPVAEFRSHCKDLVVGIRSVS